MPHTDPRPIEDTAKRPAPPWPTEKAMKIEPPRLTPVISLLDALQERRTQRILGRATLKLVSQVLCAAASARFIKFGDNLTRSRRPSIAAGAIHSVEIFIVHGTTYKRIFYFNPFDRTISPVRSADAASLQGLWEKCLAFPSAVSTLIVLVGRPNVLSLAYSNAESLLWRDSGALLQTLSMTAYGLGMGFCPLGTLGQEFIQCLPASNEMLYAVGTAWLGLSK